MAADRINILAGSRPHRKQGRAIVDDHRFIVIVKGTRSGGTWAGARAFMRRIVRDIERVHARGERWRYTPGAAWEDQDPLLRYWAIGPVYSQTLIQRREISSMLAPYWKQLVLHRAGHRVWLAGGVLIEYKSGDRPDSLVAEGLDGAWITEAARLKSEAWTDGIRSRLSARPGRPGGWCIVDSTPLGRNWFFEAFARRALENDAHHDPEYGYHHWTTAENTCSPETQADVAKARRQLPPRIFRRDYEASWEAWQGQVYEEFSRSVHVVDDTRVPALLHVVAGQDWGWSHPGALVVAGTDADGNVWVVDEEYASGLLVEPVEGGDSWVSRARAKCERWGVASVDCGPDRPENIDAYVRHGLPARGADDAVHEGIQRIATWMHHASSSGDLPAVAPRLFVHERCVNVIREIEGYRWRPMTLAAREEPLKVQDDAVDAMRYACNGLARGEPVNKITPRGNVVALDESRRTRTRSRMRSRMWGGGR